MRYRIKISELDLVTLIQHFQKHYPKESAAFLLTGVSVQEDQTDILVRRVIEVSEEDYDVQKPYQLTVSSKAINGLMALCEANSCGAGYCHSHPEEIPYSVTDNIGEEKLAGTARSFCLNQTPLTSILFYPQGILEARLWLPDGTIVKVEEIIIVGRTLQRISLKEKDECSEVLDQKYNRHILAFGEKGQVLVENTKVGIVGMGGTGSACAEQLARLGVKNFVLIDDDYIEDTNLTRIYGSFVTDVDKSKVEVAKKHILNINPDAKVKVFQNKVTETCIVSTLKDRDVIFLCTDDHWGRSVVNQLAYQYLIPTINMGVRIDSKGQQIDSGIVNVEVLNVNKPCLWCKGSIDPDRIAAEAMPESERKNRGYYVQGLDNPAPMIIPYTTLAASMAVSCFLHLVTECLGDEDVERINFFVLNNEISKGKTRTSEANCICKKVRGFGDLIQL